MKKFTLSILSLFVFAAIGFAQAKPVKVVIKTPSVQCEMCKTRIENYVMREPGVKTVTVDYKKKVTTVTYLTDRTNVENIKTAIANVGYDADDITAEESIYKRLPACCKKPVEKVAETEVKQ